MDNNFIKGRKCFVFNVHLADDVGRQNRIYYRKDRLNVFVNPLLPIYMPCIATHYFLYLSMHKRAEKNHHTLRGKGKKYVIFSIGGGGSGKLADGLVRILIF